MSFDIQSARACMHGLKSLQEGPLYCTYPPNCLAKALVGTEVRNTF